MQRLQDLLNPKAEEQEKLGFEPNWAISGIRRAAKLSIDTLSLNSNNRFMTELHQLLDPTETIPLPQGGSLTFETGHGRLLWRARTFLSEQPSLIRWIDSFSPDDVFFDIGANVGNYAIYAAATKSIPVFAFEPELNNLQLLYSNIYRNSVTQYCTPVPFACHNQTALSKFHVRAFSPGDAMHSVDRKAVYLENESNGFEINTFAMKLDELIETFDLPAPTKVKIDVDSNELQVLEGMSQTLNGVSELFIELDFDLPEHVKADALIQGLGFTQVSQESANRKFFPNQGNFVYIRESTHSRE